MQKITFDAPAMYGDHHVLEVRRVLLALSGVLEVYASSAFQAVEIVYEPDRVTPATLEAALEQAGYLHPLPAPVETGVAVTQEAERDKDIFFRHSLAFEQVKEVIRFGQTIPYAGRPLWPCPGMGVIRKSNPEEA